MKPVGVFDGQAKDLGDEKITARAVAYIQKQATAKPVLPVCGVSSSSSADGRASGFCGQIGWGLYTDCVTELDYRTGQILDAIQAAGITDDTIVVFSSDNATSPSRASVVVRMDRGGATSSIRRTKEVTASRPWCAGRKRYRGWTAKPGTVVRRRLAADARWINRGSATRSTDRPLDGINAADYLLGKRDTSGKVRSSISALTADRCR